MRPLHNTPARQKKGIEGSRIQGFKWLLLKGFILYFSIPQISPVNSGVPAGFLFTGIPEPLTYNLPFRIMDIRSQRPIKAAAKKPIIPRSEIP